MIITSLWENKGKIPDKFTCNGEDVSPTIQIVDQPIEMESMVMIMDDPDAPNGTWVHWVVFNIPPISILSEATNTGVKGKNSWGKLGYGGPCPPSGTHRYFFKLYSLDCQLDLPEGSTKEEVEKAMEGHVISKCELIGLYSKG